MVYPECPSFAASSRETHLSLRAAAYRRITHIPAGSVTIGPPSCCVISCLFRAQEIRRSRPDLPVRWGWYTSPSTWSLLNEPTKKGLRSPSSRCHSPCRPSLHRLETKSVHVLVIKTAPKDKVDDAHPVSQRLLSCMPHPQG